ncbi:MAG: SusF/SusE family outer membrane protein [Marinilabiliaceae bacterium]|jgi:hypothetical protein|nr:SusF/SusE family outer membrane protein [Marinilabiliaceae bacterium]
MKKSIIYRFTGILVVLLAIMVACTEDIEDVRLDPILSTSEVLDIASDKATVIGFVVAEGDGFTERGICYSTATEPTIDDNKVVYKPGIGGITKATFEVTLKNLNYATTYYAKAYAISDDATIYGKEITFTTLPEVPVVTTAAITEISYTTATGGGEVTDAKGSDVTARGVVWSTSSMPTVSGSKTTDGDGLGTFSSSLSGLSDNTKYYVRAYATNSAGTGYGQEVTFTTLETMERTWWVPGDFVESSYPGSGMTNWSPGNTPIVKSGQAAPDNLEGYVYFANAANWKFATQPNWDGPNYADGGGGTLDDDPGGTNMSSPAGYYFIQADASALTFSALATNWGIIGDATPGGWGGGTPMTYDPELQVWKGSYTFGTGAMKFRSNNSWDDPNPNYGSDAADGTLQRGGENIPVAIAGDYAVTMDLSNPLDYTYSLNTWGLIGEATPGGWTDDTNMTWDPVGGVFTVTLDMTAAEWKFRANDDWGVNFGGSLGALEQDGGNFSISTAGNYTITLDPWTKVATVTMN